MSLGDAQLPAARFAELRRAVMALTGSISSHADNMGRLGDISFSSSGGMLPSDLRDIYDEELRAVRLMYREYLQGGKDFRAVLAKLSTQRNDHAPVNKLPTEVLCMVFTIHRDSDGVHEHSDLPGHPIVPISQTCARWRRICLSTPNLWCKVRLGSRWAKLALDRSGSYPLNLSHDFLDGEGSVAFLERLGGHLGRVECLLLNNSLLDRVRAVFEAPPAPNLKRLSMEIFIPNVPLYSAPCVLDGQPFKGETPKLRHLELNFFRMPWSRGYYQNLTTLKIARCAAGRGSLKDKDICCILQDMPDLQELELNLERSGRWNAATDFLLTTPPSIPPGGVTLKSLHTVKLDVPVGYAKRILSTIKAPVTTLHLDVGKVYGPDVNVAELMQPETLPPNILPRIYSLSVGATSLEGLIFGLSVDAEPIFQLSWANSALNQWAVFNQIAEAMHACHTLSALERVVLDSSTEMPEGPHPMALFTAFPTVRSLKLMETGAAQVLTGMLDQRISVQAGNWPNLSLIRAEPLVEPLETKALLELCRRHPKLRDLDLSSTIIQSTSRAGLVEFVEGLKTMDVKVNWSHAELEDLSTFDGYSPEALL